MNCNVRNCNREARPHALMCSAHLERLRIHGDVLEDVPIRQKGTSGLAPEAVFQQHMPDAPPENGCWEWTGPVNDDGYGLIECTVNGKRIRDRAHRVSYRMFVGPIPDEVIVRHTCDNRPCCQPQHFLLGTRTDNSNDKVERNRQSRGLSHAVKTRGVRHYKARLTEDEVLSIRALGAEGWTQVALAKRFGCTQSNINRILLRKSWAHLEDRPFPPDERSWEA